MQLGKIESSRFESEDWIYRLKMDGLEELGSGCCATVLQSDDPDVVIKVGDVYTNDDRVDDAYLQYVQFIDGHNNPYTPRIYRLQMYRIHKGRMWYVVHMEKLISHHLIPAPTSVATVGRPLWCRDGRRHRAQAPCNADQRLRGSCA